MSAVIIDIRLARSVEAANLDAMPVSATAAENGAFNVISRYGDVSWDFYPFIPQHNIGRASKRINWAIKLPDGNVSLGPGTAESWSGALQGTTGIWSIDALCSAQIQKQSITLWYYRGNRGSFFDITFGNRGLVQIRDLETS